MRINIFQHVKKNQVKKIIDNKQANEINSNDDEEILKNNKAEMNTAYEEDQNKERNGIANRKKTSQKIRMHDGGMQNNFLMTKHGKEIIKNK